MSVDWELTTLADCSENLDKQRKPITKSKREPGPIPYYGASGIVDHVADHIFDEDLLLVSEDGANLLARTYPIAFSICSKSWVNNHAHVLRFQDISTQKFVEYYLNSISLVPWVSGMAQPKLNQTKLNEIPIPLPTLSEQKRIVAILDEAFASIDQAKANTERNIANARELFDSYLNRAFEEKGEEWEEKPLGEFVNDIATGPFGSLLHKSDYVSEGVPVVNPINIVGGIIESKKIKNITDHKKESLGNYVLHAGDIVIARRGEMGRCAVVEIDQEGWVCGTGCFIIRATKSVNPYFLCQLLRSNSCKKQMIRDSSRSTMPSISNRQLGEILISLPQKEEQDRITISISNTSIETKTIQEQYLRKETKLSELKQSILKKAFSGELTNKPDKVLSELGV